MIKLKLCLFPVVFCLSSSVTEAQKQCKIVDTKVYSGSGLVELVGCYGIPQLRLPDGETIIKIASNSSTGNFEASCYGPAQAYSTFQKLAADGKTVLWEKCYTYVPADPLLTVAIPKSDGRVLSFLYDAPTLGGLGSGPGMQMNDSLGNLLWSKSYGGIGGVGLHALMAMPDGGFVIGTTSAAYGGDVGTPIGDTGSSDVWIIRVDSNGNTVWAHSFGGTGTDECSELAYAPDGGIYVVGWTASYDSDFVSNHRQPPPAAQWASDGFIIRLDSLGNKIWSRCFGGTKSDLFYGATADGSGGVAAAGMAGSDDSDVVDHRGNAENAWTISVDSNGVLRWSKCFSSSQTGGGDLYISSICHAPDGSLWLGGGSRVSGGDVDTNYGRYDIWILHVDSKDGSLINSAVLGSSEEDGLQFMFPVDNGLAVGCYYSQADGSMSVLPNPARPGQINGALFFLDTNPLDAGDIVRSAPPWTVSPNPAKDKIRVTYTLSRAAQVRVILRNLIGDIVSETPSQFTNAGKHEQLIPVQNFQPGTYFLQLEVDGTKTAQSVLIGF